MKKQILFFVLLAGTSTQIVKSQCTAAKFSQSSPNYLPKLEIPFKETPVFRFKLTPVFRSKLTPVFRSKLTPAFLV